ncbi:MAG: 50S ribosomal protein L13 [bacterium]|nr:50S ribosomal protein L13 [bacterium]
MKNNIDQNRNWYLIDAGGATLGRISTVIATLLRGKGKVEFQFNLDCGDYVVVVNAEKVIMTGHKEEQKRYYSHSGYLGNLKTKTVTEMRKSHPTEILRHAVAGMLSNTKLKDGFLARLKLYTGENHPHANIKFIDLPKSKVK